MYPRLSDIFQDVFGFSLPLPIYSFGFMVAVGAITAAWVLQKEFDRLYGQGRLSGVRIEDPNAPKGKKRLITASPSYLVGTYIMIAVFVGFVGAKFFHILENLNDFFMAPGAMLFSSGGFTFYGGLVVAAWAIWYYSRKKGLSIGRVADAAAPALMIAYGIGRIGCHLSGDGDWGIAANMAAKPDWLPMWLYAEDYANNILGRDLSGAPVYPTPIYEFVASSLIFGVLWMLRDHRFRAGWLFFIYLIMSGTERLLIEQIRVNNTFSLFGMDVTQAEMISVALIAIGVVGAWRFWVPAAQEASGPAKSAGSSSTGSSPAETSG